MRFLSLKVFFLAFVCAFAACKQNDNFTNESGARLAFSKDTIQFDTVFTTIGSTTKSFRFYNPNDKAVKTTISLAGGEASNYRLNIDGIKTTSVSDYEIRGNDSIYVFVEVTVDPQNENSPMVIEDSVTFYTNGNQQGVKLMAYGQDVHLFNSATIKTQTWVNDKPYLIYNSLLIDSLETLTIEPGAKLHFHQNSSMIIGGTLKSMGTFEEPIVFQGDRLEQDYKDIPGQWGAVGMDANGYPTELGALLFLPGSIGNEINYTTIKNARFGLQILYSQESSPELCLKLTNSTIQNMSLLGVFSVTSSVDVSNCVFSDCGMQAMFLIGGTTNVFHSTFANYYPASFGGREEPSLVIRNYGVLDKEVYLYPTYAMFGNSIIDGSLANEIRIEEYAEEGASFNLAFDHCMIKLADTFNISNNNIYKNIIRIQSPDTLPNYIDKNNYNYRLDTLSAAKDAGKLEFANIFPLDADGVSRVEDGFPDLGAFERVEGADTTETAL